MPLRRWSSRSLQFAAFIALSLGSVPSAQAQNTAGYGCYFVTSSGQVMNLEALCGGQRQPEPVAPLPALPSLPVDPSMDATAAPAANGGQPRSRNGIAVNQSPNGIVIMTRPDGSAEWSYSRNVSEEGDRLILIAEPDRPTRPNDFTNVLPTAEQRNSIFQGSAPRSITTPSVIERPPAQSFEDRSVFSRPSPLTERPEVSPFAQQSSIFRSAPAAASNGQVFQQSTSIFEWYNPAPAQSESDEESAPDRE
jgi:hypothetical protein